MGDKRGGLKVYIESIAARTVRDTTWARTMRDSTISPLGQEGCLVGYKMGGLNFCTVSIAARQWGTLKKCRTS